MERRRGLKIGLGLVALAVVTGGLVFVATLPRDSGGDGAAESPLATATPAATVDVSDKIEPGLLELVELEEQRPGQGREEASWDIPFDQQGRVRVIIGFDPDSIVVHPRGLGTPVAEQEASQLVLAYGAKAEDEISLGNMISAYVPLDQIKALAHHEAVTDIWVDRLMMDLPDSVTPALPDEPAEGLLQYDPNTHIRADLLWAQGYAGEGIKVAFVDTGFDVEHPAFFRVTEKSAIDVNDTERDGGVTVTLPVDDPIGWPPNYSRTLSDTQDYEDHGTKMASLIGADDGISWKGVAPDSELVGVKIAFLDFNQSEFWYREHIYDLGQDSITASVLITEAWPVSDTHYDDTSVLDVILTWEDHEVCGIRPDLHLTLIDPNGNEIEPHDWNKNHSHNEGQVFEAVTQEPFRGRKGDWSVRIERDEYDFAWTTAAFTITVRGCSWTANTADLALGIEQAGDRGADVINVSWSMENNTDVFSRITEAVINDGIVVVSGAGNLGPGAETITSGNRHEITVGAIDASDVLQSWSSRGPTNFDDPALADHNGNRKPDVVAPGANIRAAVSRTSFGPQQSGSEPSWGTSVSSAVAAGGAALLREYLDDHYNFSPEQKPPIVKSLLMNGAVNVSGDLFPLGELRPIKDTNAGSGRIDLYWAWLGFPRWGQLRYPITVTIQLQPPAILPNDPSLLVKGTVYYQQGQHAIWLTTGRVKNSYMDTALGAYPTPTPQPGPLPWFRLVRWTPEPPQIVEWSFAGSYPAATPWPTSTPTFTPSPSPTPPPTWCGFGYFDDPVADYGGGDWTVVDDPGGSFGERYHLSPATSPDPPPYATWSFNASYLSIGFKMGPEFGEFVVKIDGQEVITLNANSPVRSTGQWTTGFLGYGDQPHVVQLETLTGPPLTRLGVDYFIQLYTLPENCAAPTPTRPPTLTPTPTATPSPAGPCNGDWERMVDDDEPAVLYEGAWTQIRYPPALGGSYHMGTWTRELSYKFVFETTIPNQLMVWVGEGWGPFHSGDKVEVTLDEVVVEPNTHPWEPFPYMSIMVPEPGEHVLSFFARGDPLLVEDYVVDAFLFCPDIREP